LVQRPFRPHVQKFLEEILPNLDKSGKGRKEKGGRKGKREGGGTGQRRARREEADV
jgi:hypothetical protein